MAGFAHATAALLNLYSEKSERAATLRKALPHATARHMEKLADAPEAAAHSACRNERKAAIQIILSESCEDWMAPGALAYHVDRNSQTSGLEAKCTIGLPNDPHLQLERG